MRLLVDEQLPPALTVWLVKQGQDAKHVVDLGLLGATDRQIAERAAADGAVMVTKDEDYLAWRVRTAGLRVLWLRLGNLPNARLLARLEAAWPAVVSRLDQGAELVEVMPDGQVR